MFNFFLNTFDLVMFNQNIISGPSSEMTRHLSGDVCRTCNHL